MFVCMNKDSNLYSSNPLAVYKRYYVADSSGSQAGYPGTALGGKPSVTQRRTDVLTVLQHKTIPFIDIFCSTDKKRS